MSASDLNHILVVVDPQTDPTDQALCQGVALARESGARLSAVSVVNPRDDLARLARHIGLSPQTASERLKADTQAELERRICERGHDVPVSATVRIGRPFFEIIHAVLDLTVDMVIKGAERLPGTPSDPLRRLSSTDLHLLRKCPCLLWLLAGAPAPGQSVVAAVDLSIDSGAQASREEAALNERIVDTAAHMARFLGVGVQLLHVWDAPGENLVRRWSGGEAGVITYLSEVEAQHAQALARFLDATRARWALNLESTPAITSHLLRGDPRAAIPDQAAAVSAVALVMGTVARTGVPGLIIGNTAEDILNRAPCSVITVKPPGFVSPVT